MDWPGLLKWSLKYSDGTKPTEIPSLTDEQRKWLDDAFKSLAIDEVEEMRNILVKLEKIITNPSQKEVCLNLLDQLMELICGLDNAMNFCKIGGVFAMFDNASNRAIDPEIRSLCFTLVTECTQNNHFVQDMMSRIEFWTIKEIIEENETPKDLRTRAVVALCAIIKGNNLVNKRLFLQNDGLNFLLRMILIHQADEKILSRLLSLLSDILTFDKFLHLAILRVEDESVNTNDIPSDQDLVHFKNFCLQREKEITTIFKGLSKRIISDSSMSRHHLRFSYFSCLRHHVFNLKIAKKYDKKSWSELLKDLQMFLMEIETLLKSDEFYSMEVAKVREIIAVLN